MIANMRRGRRLLWVDHCKHSTGRLWDSGEDKIRQGQDGKAQPRKN